MASNLNFEAGEVIANMALMKVSPDGFIAIFNDKGCTSIVVDVAGYFTS